MKIPILLLVLFSACFAGRVRRFTKVSQDARVLGGTVAAPGQFPWHCAVYKSSPDGVFFGAGSLIRTNYVMTVAQLVHDATEVTVHLGSNLLVGEDPNRVIVKSSSWIVHENWDAPTLWFDLALIRLPEHVTPNDYIQVIPIVGLGYLYPGKELTTMGWGQSSDDGDLVNELEYSTVSIIDQHECNDIYGEAVFGGMICAVGEGICYGDIGGAIVTPVNYWVGNYSVAPAISSWISVNGCESDDPYGFTRIDAFYDWINRKLAENP